MTTKINLGDEATHLAGLGYAVFPCFDPRNDDSPVGKKGKKPLTNKGVSDATTDLDQIAEWWKKWPTANIGLACKNCLVLDLDDKDAKRGSDDIETIIRSLGQIGPASVAETGSGGRHLFFARPDVEISGRTTVKWKNEPTGIDIRVGNQYVIAPPSLHESGKRYSWEKPLVAPEQLAPLPQVWIDGFLPHKNPAPTTAAQAVPTADELLRRAESYLDAVDPAIEGQNGSGQLFWAVSVLLWKFKLDEATTKRLITERYNPRCVPPWSEKEIDHKISDAKAKPLTNLESDAAGFSGLGVQLRTPLPKNPFVFYSHKQLLEADLTPHFLIQDVLIEGQPMIVGGPKKCLKTSILLDLALSLGSGLDFLGRFEVVKPCKVLVMSGESGLATILNAVNRIMHEKSLTWKQEYVPSMERFLKTGATPIATDVLVCDAVPHIADPMHLDFLQARLETEKPDVVIFDPAYLMIDGEKAENVMNMGLQLRRITQICQQFNATMVLAHHFTKFAGDKTCMPDLNDLSWSGFAEFARQWILLNRRAKYKSGSGFHDLNMLIGGSVGFGGEYRLTVDEGKFPDRYWNPCIFANDDENQGDFTVNGSASPITNDRARKVLDVLAAHEGGVTQKTVHHESKLSEKVLGETLEKLVESGDVIKVDKKGKNGKMAIHFDLAARSDKEEVKSQEDRGEEPKPEGADVTESASPDTFSDKAD